MGDLTLAGFLAARLDEDEAAAKAATKFRDWHAEPWYSGEFLKDGRTKHADLWGNAGMQFTGQGALDTVVADHIARHDPARVLREVETGRKLLGLAQSADDMDSDDYSNEQRAEAKVYGNLIMRALAAIWCDHPDWREDLP